MSQTKDHAAIEETLKALWPELNHTDVTILATQMQEKTYEKNQVIFKEGDRDGHFYLILEGQVEVTKEVTPTPSEQQQSPEPEQVSLVTLHAGDVAGESGLFENQPLNATLTALVTPTRVMRLPIPQFTYILETNASVSKALFKSLSKELRMFRSSLGSALGGRREHALKLAVFDFKPHEKASLEKVANVFAKSHKMNIKYLPVKLSKETAALAAGCEYVSVFVNDVANAEVLTRLSQLGCKMIALRCAGFNNVDLKVAAALNIEVARVPAYSPYAVAEHAAALALALNRKIVHAYSRVKQGNFALNNLVGFDFHGKTVGVIGTGKIGQCFVKIMLGFGCKVLCYDVYKSKELESLPNVTYVTLDELYAQSKLISLHVPLFPETKYLINKESLAKMQRGVMILNTSRGPLINTRDLIDALKSGQVGSAGLDVYEEESAYFFEDLSASVMTDDVLARLMTFNNVIITSHQAFLTEEALNAIAETTFTNIGEHISGKRGTDLTNAVRV